MTYTFFLVFFDYLGAQNFESPPAPVAPVSPVTPVRLTPRPAPPPFRRPSPIPFQPALVPIQPALVPFEPRLIPVQPTFQQPRRFVIEPAISPFGAGRLVPRAALVPIDSRRFAEPAVLVPFDNSRFVSDPFFDRSFFRPFGNK